MSELHMLRNQNQAPEEMGGGGYSDPRAAFSPRVKEFKEAVGLLYIRNNASGRNKFRLKWPQVAQFIFGAELIAMDNDGTQDRDLRAKLENEAGLRRILLKSILEEYEDKSVKSGALEFEYVGRIIDKLGVELSQLLYAEAIIERVRPGLIASVAPVVTPSPAPVGAPQAPQEQTAEIKSSDFSLDEQAEKELADQERRALQNTPQEVSLAELQNEIKSSDQFTSMKIEINDDIRPIETENMAQEINPVQDAGFPQEPQEEVEIVISQPEPPPAPEPIPEPAPIDPVQQQAEPPPLPPIPETPKKPRLQIAGLRIKDEPQEKDGDS